MRGREGLCSVTLASHATGFNLSVNTVLTSERERKKAEEASEGEVNGKGRVRDERAVFLKRCVRSRNKSVRGGV